MPRVKFDGSVAIHCSACGKFIYNAPSHPGFTTVKCVDCQNTEKVLKAELEKQKRKP